MALRASSPALSENEYDIGAALFGDDEIGGQEKENATQLGIDLDLGSEHGSDDEAFIAATQAASNRKASNLKGKSVKKGGGFQAMGLNAALLKAITKKGYKVPTPIQRRAVPLILDRQDVVGMARTGSGKTAAFVIPMIQTLKTHSAKFGARAVIMSPSRELALQTLKVVKELGRGSDLRTVLLVGGDSLDDQFSSMTTNPDIIIATPGRLLHLKVEMNLDLSSVRYIVFDEADRLFEMGFAVQLTEILHSLPTSRQTHLFSATLPKTLVEFARAGLQEPKLIRLDDNKVSPDLESAFFTIKSGEKDGALFYILDKIIKMPVGATEAAKKTKETSNQSSNSKKRKRPSETSNPTDIPTPNSTIIFAATKHRVEYLSALLKHAGYSVSYVYGNLDQTARKIQVQDFRAGLTNILVVTDVAARGLDLPYLANVINYDFPSQPKIFVHRVGRTARAGRKGWSYSLIRDSDVPYLVDLQLFLGKPLVYDRKPGAEPSYTQEVVVGSLVQDELEPMVELVNRLHSVEEDLVDLQSVAGKGEAQYVRTRNSASSESVKRAKQLLASRSLSGTHLLFGNDVYDALREKAKMLETISSFRPAESVFEIGNRGAGGEAAEVMRRRREQVDKLKQKQSKQNTMSDDSGPASPPVGIEEPNTEFDGVEDLEDPDSASDTDDLEISVSQPTTSKPGKEDWQSSEFFMSYQPKGVNVAEERGYGVHTGSYDNAQHSSNFVEGARAAQMDLTNDEIRGFAEPSKARGMRWDKKSKKYVARANDEDGSRGAKMVRGESGLKIAASFRSGRFDEWRKSNKVGRLPRVGEMETPNRAAPRSSGRHFKHKAEKAPKEADRYRDDYHVQKRRVDEAKQKRIGKFRDGGAKSELKGVDDVRKQRQLQEKRRDKNARPSKKRKV